MGLPNDNAILCDTKGVITLKEKKILINGSQLMQLKQTKNS
jgi:hypothetical protein